MAGSRSSSAHGAAPTARAKAPTPSDAPSSRTSNDPSPTSAVAPQEPAEASNGDVPSASPAGPARPRAPTRTPTSSSTERRRRRPTAPTPPETPATPSAAETPLLADSQWEREIAGFGAVLNNVLHCVTNRELVAKTAAYMATFPQHALRFQIKMKQVPIYCSNTGLRAPLYYCVLFIIFYCGWTRLYRIELGETLPCCRSGLDKY
jgi:hypothetical protein